MSEEKILPKVEVKVSAKFKIDSWDDFKLFVDHLEKNPLGVAFEIKVKGEYVV